MRLLAFAAIGACSLLAIPPRGVQAADADQAKLQGKWTVESFEYNGQPVNDLKNAVREFKDDKYTLTPAAGETYSGTVKLDSAKTPKQIDLELSDRTLKGIYEIDGDNLKIAYRLEGDERPAEFVSKADSGVVLVVHKRAK